MPRSLTVPILSVLLSAVPACRTPDADAVVVFAAASLTDALLDVSRQVGLVEGRTVRHSFAASSLLARQAERGTGVDVIALASTDWMDYLDRVGALEPGSRRTLVGNRLALVAPAQGVGPDSGRFDPEFALPPGERLVIGDPGHVPVGQYAREVLERIGRWFELEPRLALGDHARGVLATVERGDAPLGIVYVTDSRISDRVRVVAVVPDTLHSPVAYEVAVMRGRRTSAVDRYIESLSGEASQAIFARHGFVVRGAS